MNIDTVFDKVQEAMKAEMNWAEWEEWEAYSQLGYYPDLHRQAAVYVSKCGHVTARNTGERPESVDGLLTIRLHTYVDAGGHEGVRDLIREFLSKE